MEKPLRRVLSPSPGLLKTWLYLRVIPVSLLDITRFTVGPCSHALSVAGLRRVSGPFLTFER